jgi:hypothetical protein
MLALLDIGTCAGTCICQVLLMVDQPQCHCLIVQKVLCKLVWRRPRLTKEFMVQCLSCHLRPQSAYNEMPQSLTKLMEGLPRFCDRTQATCNPRKAGMDTSAACRGSRAHLLEEGFEGCGKASLAKPRCWVLAGPEQV